jgi:hypothetical protein
VYIFYPVGCHFSARANRCQIFLHLIGNLFVFSANYFFPTTAGIQSRIRKDLDRKEVAIATIANVC